MSVSTLDKNKVFGSVTTLDNSGLSEFNYRDDMAQNLIEQHRHQSEVGKAAPITDSSPVRPRLSRPIADVGEKPSVEMVSWAVCQ